MKPLQVYFPEAELARLEDWARKRRVTKSQAVRAAVRALIRPPEQDPVLALSGIVDDAGPADISERFDHYLMETYAAETAGRYRTRRRRAKRLRR